MATENERKFKKKTKQCFSTKENALKFCFRATQNKNTSKNTLYILFLRVGHGKKREESKTNESKIKKYATKKKSSCPWKENIKKIKEK